MREAVREARVLRPVGTRLFRALGRGEAARDGKLFWGDMKRYARAGPRVGGSTTYERLPFG